MKNDNQTIYVKIDMHSGKIKNKLNEYKWR